MFFQDREVTMRGILAVGEARCGYLGGPNWLGRRCDCKYGFDGSQNNYSEQNGCPELRSTYKALEAMTDEEWNDLTKRAGGTNTHAISREQV